MVGVGIFGVETVGMPIFWLRLGIISVGIDGLGMEIGIAGSGMKIKDNGECKEKYKMDPIKEKE